MRNKTNALVAGHSDEQQSSTHETYDIDHELFSKTKLPVHMKEVLSIS